MIKNILIILATFFISCDGKNPDSKKKVEETDAKTPQALAEEMNYKLRYKLTEPDFTYEPGNILKEISGISFIDNDHLACVQDEAGIMYIYNVKTADIDSKVNFGPKGDYESVTVAGKDAYVLTSQGKIIEIQNYAGKKPEIKQYQTGFNAAYNFESMCYDRQGNRLLFMSKDKSEEKNKKGIYSFNLLTKKTEPGTINPVSTSEIKTFTDRDNFPGLSNKMKKGIEDDDINGLFRPTDLAIHPLTGEIYIISSVGNLLLILDKSGKLVFLCPLEDSRFMQPEGIAFSDAGDLYISNEGQNGKPNILKFSYEK